MFMKLAPKPDSPKTTAYLTSEIKLLPVKPSMIKNFPVTQKVQTLQSKPSTMIQVKPPAKRQLIEIQDVQIIRPASSHQIKIIPSNTQKLMVPMSSKSAQQPIKVTSIVSVPTTTTNIATSVKPVRPPVTVVKLPYTKVVEAKKRSSGISLQIPKPESTIPRDIGCIACKAHTKKKSNFCSDECLRKYVTYALPKAVHSEDETANKKVKKNLFEDLLLSADSKPKFDRICVYERSSGQILTGENAPTSANVRKWLQDHPTFEIVQTGTQQALEVEVSLKCI